MLAFDGALVVELGGCFGAVWACGIFGAALDAIASGADESDEAMALARATSTMGPDADGSAALAAITEIAAAGASPIVAALRVPSHSNAAAPTATGTKKSAARPPTDGAFTPRSTAGMMREPVEVWIGSGVTSGVPLSEEMGAGVSDGNARDGARAVESSAPKAAAISSAV